MTSRKTDEVFQAAMDLCASEPVHLLGTVQPHGALIAVDNRSLEILFASENTTDFLRVGHDRLLGKTLDEVFARKTRYELVKGMMLRETEQLSRDLGIVQFGCLPLLVSSCVSDGLTIFEFEAAPEQEPPDGKFLRDLEFMMGGIRASRHREELFEKSVQLLQMLTGYDRVMIYEFDESNNGRVEAEAAFDGSNSFLGLNFPAWDIPDQARDLMAKIPFRYIADVDASPSMVYPASAALPHLDLTHSHLRASSRVHLEYLRNMGSAATFTLNIVMEDRLWGMISFHHSGARYPNQTIRQMCRNFADFFTLQLTNFMQAAQLDCLQKADDLLQKLSRSADAADADASFEAALLKDLLDAMQADGAALVQGSSIVKAGLTPSELQLRAFLEGEQWPVGVTSSSKLAEDFPRLFDDGEDEICGLLVARLCDDTTFFFFRRGRDRVVRWAGAPEKTVSVLTGRPRLTPRASFEAYSVTVRGTSAPWTTEQLRIAQELRWLLRPTERSALIEKTADQQEATIGELNHRVRTMLALIRSLSQSASAQDGSIRSHVEELHAHIAAVASAHDPGDETGETAAHESNETAPLEIASSKCLIVADNNVLALDTERVLKDLGFDTIETALDVRDALARLECFEPGMAILDISLSGGRTSEPVAQALAERGIPFVFVTGYGDKPKSSSFASIPVLEKPIQAEALRSLLQLGP